VSISIPKSPFTGEGRMGSVCQRGYQDVPIWGASAPQVLDLIGGANGVRTRDLLRDRQAF
jgi:hypothetical protein